MSKKKKTETEEESEIYYNIEKVIIHAPKAKKIILQSGRPKDPPPRP